MRKFFSKLFLVGMAFCVAHSALAANFTSKIYNSTNGLCFHVVGDLVAQGSRIEEMSCGAAYDNQFNFTLLSDGNYNVHPSGNNNLCIGIQGASTAAGAEVMLWSCIAGHPDQEFSLSADGGAFYLKDKNSSLCLDDTNRGMTNGSMIQQWGCNTNSSNNWNQLYQVSSTTDQVMLGATSDTEPVDSLVSSLGGKLAIHSVFYSWGWSSPGAAQSSDVFPGGSENDDYTNKRATLITWEMTAPTGDMAPSNAANLLTDIYNSSTGSGIWDAEFINQAQQFKTWYASHPGHKFFIRLMHEMNISNPWGAYYPPQNISDPSRIQQYINAFRHIVQIFQAQGVDQANGYDISWVWCPDGMANVPTSNFYFVGPSWNTFYSYYPGDDVVDYVAFDIYPTYLTTTSPFSVAILDYYNWNHGGDSAHARYVSNFKPMMIAEAGVPAPVQTSWLNAAESSIKSSFSDIQAFVWFSHDYTSSGGPNFTLTSSPGFEAMMGDAYFQLMPNF